MLLETGLTTGSAAALAGDGPCATPRTAPPAANSSASLSAKTAAVTTGKHSSPKPAVGSALPRLVLDSNVWVDILIFADPRARPLLDALEAAAIDVVIDSHCLEELKRVIDYPQFARFALDRDLLLGRVDNWTRRHEACAPPGLELPRCRDPDDQKFLELAASAGADWLLTKDRALLRLAHHTRRDFAFDVARPEVFLARHPGPLLFARPAPAQCPSLPDPLTLR